MNRSLRIAEAAKATGLSPYTRRLEADMRTLGETLQTIRKKIRIYQDLQATPKHA
jgi:hypothetical protein